MFRFPEIEIYFQKCRLGAFINIIYWTLPTLGGNIFKGVSVSTTQNWILFYWVLFYWVLTFSIVRATFRGKECTNFEPF